MFLRILDRMHRWCGALSASKKGRTWRDRYLCFLLIALSQTDPRRKRRIRLVGQAIRAMGGRKYLLLRLRHKGRSVDLCFRRQDEADWTSAADMLRAPYRPPHGRPISHIYDMGANIGTFALLAKTEFPEAEIHCYEPSLENFHLLRLNFRINRLTGDLQRVACWGYDGKIYFRASPSNAGWVADRPPGIEVPCVLPRLVEHCWVKMDIEGSEFNVLPQLLDQPARPLAFALEVHWQSPYRTDVASLLKSVGYEPDLPIDPTALCQELNYFPAERRESLRTAQRTASAIEGHAF